MKAKRGSWVLAVSLALAACEGRIAGPPVGFQLAGEWNYRVYFNYPEDQCLGVGTLTLDQTDSTVTGRATRYTSSCPVTFGTYDSARIRGDSLYLHIHDANTCTLRGHIVSADSIAGEVHCLMGDLQWVFDGEWNAARLGAAAGLDLTPASRSVVTGSTHPLMVRLRDATGHTLYGRPVTWSTSNPSVATVSLADTVLFGATLSAVGAGSAMITASAGGLLQTAAFQVSMPAFTRVSAGGNFTCALTAAGAAWCWGEGGGGQLGDGSGLGSTTPVAVSGGQSFASISAGSVHACGVTTGGQAWCWGSGANGRLGTADSAMATVPHAVIQGALVFASISAGNGNTCAVTASSAAYCWGYGGYGALGTGSRTSRATPTLVSGGLAFTRVVAGVQHSCGVTAAGATWCWGDNLYGQLGTGVVDSAGTSVPVALASGAPAFAAVTLGGIFTCGAATAGFAYCWGNGVSGALGNGGNAVSVPAPAAVSGAIGSVADVTAGSSHACLRTSAGQAWCWGVNWAGMLGNGVQDAGSNVPVSVTGGPFSAIGAGGSHSCGVTATGVVCWGYNVFGELGDGTTTSRPAPVKVVGQP